MASRLGLHCAACLFSLLIVCSGCGDPGTITIHQDSPANGILSDGKSSWRLSVVSGALQVAPYSGSLPATDLYLTDHTTGATYAITLTPDDELTWSRTSTAAGTDSLPLNDEVTGAAHSLTLQNGALNY